MSARKRRIWTWLAFVLISATAAGALTMFVSNGFMLNGASQPLRPPMLIYGKQLHWRVLFSRPITRLSRFGMKNSEGTSGGMAVADFDGDGDDEAVLCLSDSTLLIELDGKVTKHPTLGPDFCYLPSRGIAMATVFRNSSRILARTLHFGPLRICKTLTLRLSSCYPSRPICCLP